MSTVERKTLLRDDLLSRIAALLDRDGGVIHAEMARLLYVTAGASFASLARTLRGCRGGSISTLKRRSKREGYWSRARLAYRVAVADRLVARLQGGITGRDTALIPDGPISGGSATSR